MIEFHRRDEGGEVKERSLLVIRCVRRLPAGQEQFPRLREVTLLGHHVPEQTADGPIPRVHRKETTHRAPALLSDSIRCGPSATPRFQGDELREHPEIYTPCDTVMVGDGQRLLPQIGQESGSLSRVGNGLRRHQ